MQAGIDRHFDKKGGVINQARMKKGKGFLLMVSNKRTRTARPCSLKDGDDGQVGEGPVPPLGDTARMYQNKKECLIRYRG